MELSPLLRWLLNPIKKIGSPPVRGVMYHMSHELLSLSYGQLFFRQKWTSLGHFETMYPGKKRQNAISPVGIVFLRGESASFALPGLPDLVLFFFHHYANMTLPLSPPRERKDTSRPFFNLLLAASIPRSLLRIAEIRTDDLQMLLPPCLNPPLGSNARRMIVPAFQRKMSFPPT